VVSLSILSHGVLAKFSLEPGLGNNNLPPTIEVEKFAQVRYSGVPVGDRRLIMTTL